MVFESIYESAQAKELILIDGGFCRYHVRKDGDLTIREIISTRPGAGTEMLNMLKENKKIYSIFARCPARLEANKWYQKKGFEMEKKEKSKQGAEILCWRLRLKKKGFLF